jgi:Tfp pilus assembly protein PilW
VRPGRDPHPCRNWRREFPGPARSHGFTIVEVAVGGAILSTLLFALVSTLLSTQKASSSATRTMDVSEVLRGATRRITEELRSSSRVGEDTNENSTLDAGEDTNGNGRLDSDWQVTSTSVTFNRYMLGSVFSLPITYRLTGTDLERVVMEDPSGTTAVTVIARSVSAFTVTDTGGRVSILLRVARPTPGGGTLQKERTAVIMPRN